MRRAHFLAPPIPPIHFGLAALAVSSPAAWATDKHGTARPAPATRVTPGRASPAATSSGSATRMATGR